MFPSGIDDPTDPDDHRGDHIARWGLTASKGSRFFYLVGPEYGTSYLDGEPSNGDQRDRTIRILRCDPDKIGVSNPWVSITTKFCDSNGNMESTKDYEPSYLVSESASFESDTWTTERTLQYTALESDKQRLWVAGSVHDWGASQSSGSGGPGISGYLDGVRLLYFTNYGKTLKFDIRLPDEEGSCLPFRSTFMLDLATAYLGTDPNNSNILRHRIFVLARDKHEDNKNPPDVQVRLYVYETEDDKTESLDPCGYLDINLFGVFDVPGLKNDNATLYFDDANDNLYVVGRRTTDTSDPTHKQMGVWRINDTAWMSATLKDPNCSLYFDAAWDWEAVPVDPPLFVQNWPGVNMELVQTMSRRSGGTLPTNGLHVVATYWLPSWTTTYNDNDRSEEGNLLFSNQPGRLMRDARGVWDMQLDIFGNFDPQDPCSP